MLFSLLVFLPVYRVSARSIYARSVPNARNVVFQGQDVLGLGHPFNLPFILEREEGNPFGIAYEEALDIVGDDGVWNAICDLDSDGDGRSNGLELCDPECVFQLNGEDPVCPEGLQLTHPGFDDGIDVVEITEIPGEGALKAHGWLMILGWCVFAPYGILRAVFSKKGPSLAWFFEHKVAMALCLVCNVLAMIIIIAEFKLEPLERGFETLGDNDSAAHTVAGLFVLILLFIQPISGVIRPHLPKPGEPKGFLRLLWEFQHQMTGRVGIILAFYAIFVGLPLVYPEGGEEFGTFLIVMLALVGVVSIVFVFGFRSTAYPKVGGTTAEIEKREAKKDVKVEVTVGDKL